MPAPSPDIARLWATDIKIVRRTAAPQARFRRSRRYVRGQLKARGLYCLMRRDGCVIWFRDRSGTPVTGRLCGAVLTTTERWRLDLREQHGRRRLRAHPRFWFVHFPVHPFRVLVIPDAVIPYTWKVLRLPQWWHRYWNYMERWDVIEQWPALPADLLHPPARRLRRPKPVAVAPQPIEPPAPPVASQTQFCIPCRECGERFYVMTDLTHHAWRQHPRPGSRAHTAPPS